MSKIKAPREGSDVGFNLCLGKSGLGCSESENYTRERAPGIRHSGDMGEGVI